MPKNKNNFSDDLEQIRTSVMNTLDEIDEIRERDGRLSRDLERIQTDAMEMVFEIDEIKQRENVTQGEK